MDMNSDIRRITHHLFSFGRKSVISLSMLIAMLSTPNMANAYNPNINRLLSNYDLDQVVTMADKRSDYNFYLVVNNLDSDFKTLNDIKNQVKNYELKIEKGEFVVNTLDEVKAKIKPGQIAIKIDLREREIVDFLDSNGNSLFEKFLEENPPVINQTSDFKKFQKTFVPSLAKVEFSGIIGNKYFIIFNLNKNTSNSIIIIGNNEKGIEKTISAKEIGFKKSVLIESELGEFRLQLEGFNSYSTYNGELITLFKQ